MGKVYIVVREYHNDSVEEAINWPYIDAEDICCFSNKEAADIFAAKNFTKFKKADNSFVDLKVVEYNLLD